VTNFNIPLTVEGVRLCRRANGRRRLLAPAHHRRPPKTRSPRWPTSGEQPKKMPPDKNAGRPVLLNL